jgi:hypothetical protein
MWVSNGLLSWQAAEGAWRESLKGKKGKREGLWAEVRVRKCLEDALQGTLDPETTDELRRQLLMADLEARREAVLEELKVRPI